MGYTLIALSTGTFECMQILFCYIFLYMIAGLCIWLVFLVLQLKYKHIKKQNKDLADLNLLSKSNNILALFFSITVTYISPSSAYNELLDVCLERDEQVGNEFCLASGGKIALVEVRGEVLRTAETHFSIKVTELGLMCHARNLVAGNAVVMIGRLVWYFTYLSSPDESSVLSTLSY